jgi:hypothetical protein
MSRLFLGVPRIMKEKVIDYLTLKMLLDKDFQSNPNQRMKTAYILAKKEYNKLTEAQIDEIWRKIKDRIK